MEVITHVDANWLKVKRTTPGPDQEGLAPINYVEVVKQEDKLTAPSNEEVPAPRRSSDIRAQQEKLEDEFEELMNGKGALEALGKREGRLLVSNYAIVGSPASLSCRVRGR